MKKKTAYRLRNWGEYNKALKQRGSLTVWVSAEALENWVTKEKTGSRGASCRFTDLAIETMATVQAVYRQAGRQTQGFLQSVFQLMKIALPVPDHSTLSRRRGQLEIELPVRPTTAARHLVIDSTGVKVYGEGEWKVRQHGVSKRRTWRKLHICMDATTWEMVAVGASTNDVSDGEMLPRLLDGLPAAEIGQVSADGAYDQRGCYDAIRQVQAQATIPPRHGAKIWQHANCHQERQLRDENLRRIRRVGRKKWKVESDYHQRSLVETSVFRYKTICGDRLQTRKLENQFTEMFIKCALLNRMTHLGMPDSYKLLG
jgi:Transposase DDE domain